MKKLILALASFFVACPLAICQETLPKTSLPKTSLPSEIAPIGPIETVGKGYAFTEGPAWDPDGFLYFTDIPANSIHRLDAATGEITVFTDQSRHSNGLMVAADGRLLACQMDGRVVVYDKSSGEPTVLADQYDAKRLNAPNDLVIDPRGGIYFTDPLFRAPEPLPQTIQAVYYIAADGKVTRVTEGLAAPNGIGLSPDGKRLYVAPSQQAEMLVYDVDGPGQISGGRVFCSLTQPDGKQGTGGDGMTVDVLGNVYFTTNLGVEIVSPDGVSLTIVRFPEQPANVTFMGKERKTLVVTARTSVYRVEMPVAGLAPN